MNVGKYRIGKTLGHGSFGKVKQAVDTESGRQVAIKVLDKAKISEHGMGHQIKKEISVMKLVKHPSIIELYEVLASEKKIFIVIELVTGGELFDYIVKNGRFTEEQARAMFRQLIFGVEFCHLQGVYHRDLKPENILLDGKGGLKISDFGLSAMGPRDHLFHTTCGTPNYVAPEVLMDKGYRGDQADVWSAGVILYVLLAGFLPFDEPSMSDLFRKIVKADVAYPKWMTEDAISLIVHILDPDPQTRYTIRDIKAHPWFIKGHENELDQTIPLLNPSESAIQSAITDLSATQPLPFSARRDAKTPTSFSSHSPVNDITGKYSPLGPTSFGKVSPQLERSASEPTSTERQASNSSNPSPNLTATSGDTALTPRSPGGHPLPPVAFSGQPDTFSHLASRPLALPPSSAITAGPVTPSSLVVGTPDSFSLDSSLATPVYQATTPNLSLSHSPDHLPASPVSKHPLSLVSLHEMNQSHAHPIHPHPSSHSHPDGHSLHVPSGSAVGRSGHSAFNFATQSSVHHEHHSSHAEIAHSAFAANADHTPTADRTGLAPPSDPGSSLPSSAPLSESTSSNPPDDSDVKETPTVSPPITMNAFDLINMVGFQALNRMFHSESDARAKTFTQFSCSLPSAELFAICQRVLEQKAVPFSANRASYVIHASLDQAPKAPLEFTVQLFQMTPTLQMVECRREKGDMLAYQQWYHDFRAAVESIAPPAVANSSSGSRLPVEMSRLHLSGIANTASSADSPGPLSPFSPQSVQSYSVGNSSPQPASRRFGPFKTLTARLSPQSSSPIQGAASPAQPNVKTSKSGFSLFRRNKSKEKEKEKEKESS